MSFTGPAKCERCKDGEYSDKPNAHFCDLCVADKLRIVKRLKPNGEVVKRNVGCDTCVAVTKNGRKRNLCGKCGFDSYREYNKIDMNNGNVVAGDGTCHECPMGTDSSGKKGWAGSKSMCLPCQPGFKRKQYERQCTPCPHGVIQAPGKGAMFCRTIMKPASATSKPIVSPTDCDSGYESAFINSDGVCVTCAPGSRRDPLLNSCVVCPPGSVSLGGTSTTCDVCPAKAGARPLADGSRCTCGDGRVYSASKGTCYSCGPGMFRNDADHLPDAGGCLPCEVGWVAPKYGSAKCSMCPYGMIAYTPGRSQDEDRLAVGDTMCRKCDRDEGQVEELLSFTNLYYFMGATKCINGRTLQGQFYGYNESGTPKDGNYLVSDWYYLTGFKPVNGEY